MDLKEFCGLLQDHISWYQDRYFIYLLDHVNEAANKEQNGEDEASVVKNDDSDDDVIIVKEVKGMKRENDITVPKNVEVKKADNTSVSVANKRVTSEGVSGKESCTKEQKKAVERVDGCSASAVAKSDVGKETVSSELKNEGHKKESSTSDGSKKLKNRKRKQAIHIEDSDDSDEEINIRKKQNRTTNIYSIEKRNNRKERDEKEERLLLDDKVGSKEETAKWVLQLPNYNDGEHSEDPDNDSDDEDSETYLQLTYGKVREFTRLYIKVDYL